jgi:glycine/D-amino acid oxidase-like deaminating enzyme
VSDTVIRQKAPSFSEVVLAEFKDVRKKLAEALGVDESVALEELFRRRIDEGAWWDQNKGWVKGGLLATTLAAAGYAFDQCGSKQQNHTRTEAEYLKSIGGKGNQGLIGN